MIWGKRYYKVLHSYRVAINLGLLVVTAVSIFLAAHLDLKTDFSELLPDRLASVKAIKEAQRRIGGTGLLLVGIEGPHFEANKKFAEAMAEKIRPLEADSLRYFEYKYDDVRDFAEKYGLHYLTETQLRNVATHIEGELVKHKDQAVSDFLGLGDDDKATSTTANQSKADPKTPGLLESLDPNLRAFLEYREGYLSTQNGKILVLALRPKGSSLSVESSQKLVDKLRGFIRELNPSTYDPEMHVDLAGNVLSTIDEFETIKHDIVDTALMLVGLLLLALFIFFWSWRLILLLSANLLLAVIWTFGLTKLHIGYLNTQTAFLGSLVAGTGINYGIILLWRYLELRRQDQSIDEAISIAIENTMLATLTAALTTAISFVSLYIAQNKGFSQFAFIGTMGILLCWIAAYTVLPLWLTWMERHFPDVHHYQNPLGKFFYARTLSFGNLITRRAKPILLFLGVISVIGIPHFIHFIQDPWEYNFDNLRNKVTNSSIKGGFEDRISAVFPKSLSPSLVLLQSPEQAKEICPAVNRIKSEIPADKNIIESCMGIYELLPADAQEGSEKLRLIMRVKDLLGNRLLKFSDEAELYARLHQKLSMSVPKLADIPPQLVRRFKELDGRVGYFAFVNPDGNKPLNDGRNLLAFTDSLARIPLPKTDTVVSATGDSFILADLLRGIQHDGPILSLVAFAGAIFITLVLCGGLWNSFLMILCLAAGTWWMICTQSLLNFKFNFFNFIAVPLTFGIAIDYPINVFIRCRQEKFKNFGKVLVSSGTAVLLCSLTTIIGYYTLVGAASQALASFAKLAILGEFACLIATFFLLPTILRMRGKFREESLDQP